MLIQERLLQVLDYSPKTGVFTRRLKQTGVAQGAIAGSMDQGGYLVTSVDGKLYKCHRLAWLYIIGNWPQGVIDHINGNKSDNRFENLRDVTKTQNIQNQRKAQISNKSTGVLGVFKNGSGFAARISHNNTKIYLGTFKTTDEAKAAYIAAKRVLHISCTI
jgi:radical SAM protein with 4Fe4S-binding SPASM domain